MDATQRKAAWWSGYSDPQAAVWHTLFALVVPMVGWLASMTLTIFGPLDWWGNYLLAGAVWGVTRPARKLFRNAIKFANHEFRSAEYSWWTCVKEETAQEIGDWRHKPLKSFGAYVIISLGMTISWLVIVPLWAIVQGHLDHG